LLIVVQVDAIVLGLFPPATITAYAQLSLCLFMQLHSFHMLLWCIGFEVDGALPTVNETFASYTHANFTCAGQPMTNYSQWMLGVAAAPQPRPLTQRLRHVTTLPGLDDPDKNILLLNATVQLFTFKPT
jgi:hypothetical protein